MGILNDIEERIFGGGDEGLSIADFTLEELNEEKANIRADVKLKRDRHTDLAEKRENLFEDIVETDDELLQRELAEEIVSIEDEMAILHNEHKQLMDALRVIDGIIALKRKEKMAEREGLLNELQQMDKDSLVDTLRRADVREMIREEKWDDLQSLLHGQLEPADTDSQRVDEIIGQAEDVRHLEEEMGTQEAIKHALEERDHEREDEDEQEVEA